MAKLTKEQVAEIKTLLADSYMAQVDIASKMGVMPQTISKINVGKTYSVQGTDYPIRTDQRNPRQSAGPIMNDTKIRRVKIQEDLIYSDLTFKEIAANHYVSFSTVSRLNSGSRGVDPDLEYPLRRTREMLGRQVRVDSANGMTSEEIEKKYIITRRQVYIFLRSTHGGEDDDS
jgi:hypothetical protein